MGFVYLVYPTTAHEIINGIYNGQLTLVNAILPRRVIQRKKMNQLPMCMDLHVCNLDAPVRQADTAMLLPPIFSIA